MKFRVARHTNDLERISEFYLSILPIEIIGHFENHEGYNGIFLGNKDSNWEIEFTSSDTETHSDSDEDDLLVFYLNDIQIKQIINRLKELGINRSMAKNPYWNRMGIYFQDPDGFGIVVARENRQSITEVL